MSAIEISAMTLQSLKDVGELVPGARAIVSLALEIHGAIQNSRGNTEAKRLGNDVVAVAAAVTDQFKKIEGYGQTVPSPLQEHAKTLKRTLEEIHDFVNTSSQRNCLMRILFSRSDKKAIQKHREQLQQAIGLFGVQSHLELRAILDRVESHLLKQMSSETVEPTGEIPTVDSPAADISTFAPSETANGISGPGFCHDPSSLSPPPNSTCTSPAVTSSSSSPAFFSNSQASITGNVTFNSVSGDQNITTNNVNNSNVNTGNIYHRDQTITSHAYSPNPEALTSCLAGLDGIQDT
ncbi:hypothetical protein VNI00_019473, partial [Paramarasmius palmivorus]